MLELPGCDLNVCESFNKTGSNDFSCVGRDPGNGGLCREVTFLCPVAEVNTCLLSFGHRVAHVSVNVVGLSG